MVPAFCIAAPTRPLPRLFSGCVRLDPTVASGYALHCLTTVLGRFKSVHFWGDGRSWHGGRSCSNRLPTISKTQHNTPLDFRQTGCVQTRITREELHIAAQQYLFYHLLVAVRVRRVAGLAIWSDLARLHCMCAGTRLSILSLPPAARGITWSAVNANGCAVLRPQ